MPLVLNTCTFYIPDGGNGGGIVFPISFIGFACNFRSQRTRIYDILSSAYVT